MKCSLVPDLVLADFLETLILVGGDRVYLVGLGLTLYLLDPGRRNGVR